MKPLAAQPQSHWVERDRLHAALVDSLRGFAVAAATHVKR
jgi:hypothetical protein